MDIGDLREHYTRAELDEGGLAEDPLVQFERWFKEACDAELPEPNAMCLSTVSPEGQPSSRTVLLKSFDGEGFVFYTNYGSRKAKEMEVNSRVSLLFPWLGLERQVIVSGRAERVSTAESLKYFLSRPRGSQIGAWVSRQSSVVTSRSLIEAKLDEMKRKFAEGEVPLPSFWGGYRVVPVFAR
jgi:pyridoxamine 5'-phosphate oxidase